MAVRYRREYDLIIGEMVDALKHLEGYFEFLGLGSKEWDASWCRNSGRMP